MSEPIRIILVDDHRLFREGLARLIAGSGGGEFRVVGQASSGEEFLELIDSPATTNRRSLVASANGSATPSEATPLYIVFMDIDMPGGMNGAEASRLALGRLPQMKIIALSMHGESEYYLPMMEAGVKGFLLKSSDFSEVVAAIRAVVAGGTYFSQELMASLVATVRGGDEMPHEESLSEREAQILPLVCGGLSNRQIAEKLFISKRTVDKHRAGIMAKTGCHNTADLVIYAVKNKIIEI